jgi:hypothetical protein
MSQASKTAGAQYAGYLRLLPQSVVEVNNQHAQARAQKAADAFAESFGEGTCPVFKKMRLTPRQTHRLLKRYRDGGAASIANRRRGRPSNNRLSDVVRDHAIFIFAAVLYFYSIYDRLAQATKLPTRAARLGRRRCDVEVSAAPAQATSEAAE